MEMAQDNGLNYHILPVDLTTILGVKIRAHTHTHTHAHIYIYIYIYIVYFLKSFYVIYLGYAQILHCLLCHSREKCCRWTDQTRAALCIHYDQNSTSTLDVHNLTMNDRTHLFKIRCQITYIHTYIKVRIFMTF